MYKLYGAPTMLEHLTLALTEALQDEYKARATYRAIIQKFGPVRPFVNIVEAEERHIQALLPLFIRYGIPVPEDHWPAQVTVPDSVVQACQEGVQGEIENGLMYERLLTMTVDYPDVQRVFLNLQRASQQNHLQAFQRCAARKTCSANVGPQPTSSGGKTHVGGCKNMGKAEVTDGAFAEATQRYGRRRRCKKRP
jgi:hypothetical protein